MQSPSGRPSTITRWMRDYSFAPRWLPEGLRGQRAGTAIALLAMTVGTLSSHAIVALDPTFPYPNLLFVLLIIAIAATWGVMPAFVTILITSILYSPIVLNGGVLGLQIGPAATRGDYAGALAGAGVGVVIAVATGVAARRQITVAAAHAELRRSEKQYRTIVETAQEGIWQIDAQDRTVYVNPKLADLLGYSVDEMLGQSLYAFAPEGGQVMTRKRIEQRHLGETEHMEVQYRRKDGSALWALVAANPLFDDREQYAGGLAMLTDITERRRADETRAALAAIVERSSDAIIGVALDSRIENWNASAERLYGFTAQEAIGQQISMLVPPERLQESLALVARVARGERVEHFETIRRHRDGTTFPVSLSASPLTDAAGGLRGAAVIVRDLSAREQVAEAAALARVSAALSSSLDSSQLYTIVLEQAASILPCDYALLVLFQDGWATVAASWGEPRLPAGTPFYPLDGPGRPWRPEQLDTVTYLADTALEPDWQDISPWQGEHRVRSIISVPLRAGGDLRGSLDVASGRPHQYRERDLRIATVIAERVAQALGNARIYQMEQRRAQKLAALQALTAGLSAALSPAEVARVVLGQGWEMLGALTGIIRLLTPDGALLEQLETIGVPLTGPLHRNRVPIDDAVPICEAVRTGAPVWLRSPQDWEARYPLRAPYYLAAGHQATAALPLLVNGRVIGAMAVSYSQPEPFDAADSHVLTSMADLIAQALERARLHGAEQERIRVAEELARLSQEQAREAAALAHLQSELVATVSHELRTPINAILGFAEVLKDAWQDDDPATHRQQLNMIVSAASRQQRLVQDLLLLSKLDLGMLAAHGEPLEMLTLGRQAAAEVRASYPGQRITARGPDTPPVLADGGRVLQILTNLLDNAAKYSPEGSPISLWWRVEGTQAVLRVRDRGTGIPEEGRERLFTRFGKVPGSQARRGRRGTGLGLYLSQRLAEAMGGDLELEVTGPTGSIFRLRLPLAP